MRSAQPSIQATPDFVRQVSGGGHNFIEGGHFKIKETVIHGLDNLFFQNVFEFFEIHHHAGHRVSIAFQCHFQNVVVAMPGGVRFRAVDVKVFCFGQTIDAANVRR